MKFLVVGLVMLMASVSLVAADQYTVTLSGGSSATYTAAGGQIVVTTNYKPPAGSSSSAGRGSTVSNVNGYLQIDFLQLQQAGITLNQIVIANPNGNVFGFWGSQDPSSQGTILGYGQSFSTAVNSNQWPTDATGTPYRYIAITDDSGGISSITVQVVVQCTCSAGVNGDPQFSGLQGQNFQFHGMADEIFSLISSPALRVNSLFKYIASGSCEYNDTMCWTHPGTYLEQIALTYGRNKILLKSGSHAEGMSAYVNGKEMVVDPYMMVQLKTPEGVPAMIKFSSSGVFTFESELFYIRIVNSDYFFNFDFALKDQSVLAVGAKELKIQGEICEKEAATHLHGSHELHKEHSDISKRLTAVYPDFPLHGLVGQTWRNAQFCGRYFEGTVDDYVTSRLFGNPPAFNFFKY